MAQANSWEIMGSEAYATAADFEQIFTDHMSFLYLLSFLLTGDEHKAEECFVAGIGESAKGNRVFKEWACSWARRTIVRSAIRLIAPRQNLANAKQNRVVTRAMDKVPLLLRAEVFARFASSRPSSASFSSCRLSNAIPITIVQFFWVARGGI